MAGWVVGRDASISREVVAPEHRVHGGGTPPSASLPSSNLTARPTWPASWPLRSRRLPALPSAGSTARRMLGRASSCDARAGRTPRSRRWHRPATLQLWSTRAMRTRTSRTKSWSTRRWTGRARCSATGRSISPRRWRTGRRSSTSCCSSRSAATERSAQLLQPVPATAGWIRRRPSPWT